MPFSVASLTTFWGFSLLPLLLLLPQAASAVASASNATKTMETRIRLKAVDPPGWLNLGCCRLDRRGYGDDWAGAGLFSVDRLTSRGKRETPRKIRTTPAKTSQRARIRWPKMPIAKPASIRTTPGCEGAGGERRDEVGDRADYHRRMPDETVAEVKDALAKAGYLADEPAALVSFLAQRLGKPILVEGPAGVGKTELAKALSRATGRELIRLQCYEGLDEAKALYEWNYRKQLLRIQAGKDQAAPGGGNEDPSASNSLGPHEGGGDGVLSDIFSGEFLLERPLMQAIASPEPVVLLIDEIDKTDQEFEAMLLELLSDFQITIPELGQVSATTMPIVVLTSNNSRELTEALKRRCLYLWLDYPEVEREMEIVRLHAPELPEALARRLVEVVRMIRALDLKKPPSIAESIDWARTLLLMGAEDIDRETFEQSMSIIVKHRTDIDLVAERVGVKLAEAPAQTAG